MLQAYKMLSLCSSYTWVIIQTFSLILFYSILLFSSLSYCFCIFFPLGGDLFSSFKNYYIPLQRKWKDLISNCTLDFDIDAIVLHTNAHNVEILLQ